MTIKLGSFEQVDFRSVWTNESRDFTPWLAEEQNLKLLGEVIGIDLELVETEKKIGPYRVDIACKDIDDESWVAIENQIEKADHKHLGQLLTYASGLDAKTIVWIATEFDEQHRAAIDWLNQSTLDSVRFFCIKVELWKIGDSLPAPRFNIICQPNEWQKKIRDITETSDRPSSVLRINYWTAFQNFLVKNKSRLQPRTPKAKHYYSFGIGSSLANLNALLIITEKRIGVGLTIRSENSTYIFHAIFKQKREYLEREFPIIEWKELPDIARSKIVIYKNVDIDDENDWENQFLWLQQTLEKFDEIFRDFFSNNKFNFEEE